MGTFFSRRAIILLGLLSVSMCSTTAPAAIARSLGVDVSHFNATVDWTQVRSSGKDFAFCKASEGVSVLDNQFTANMTNGRSAGVMMGASHLAHPESNTALAEAAYFASVLAPYLSSDYLRPALDLEHGGGL